MTCAIRVLFDQPEIPGNTGSTIRLSAVTGCEFHLAGPLGFDLDSAKLRRAGLDYHEWARLHVHQSLDAALGELAPTRVFAFTTTATTDHTAVDYQAGDVLLFGRESTGLSPEALADDRITRQLKIPMLAERRSLNLATSAAIGVYEAWRQFNFSRSRR